MGATEFAKIIINMMTIINMHCSNAGGITPELCYKKMWNCAHKTSSVDAILAEAHNCITYDLNGQLDINGRKKSKESVKDDL